MNKVLLLLVSTIVISCSSKYEFTDLYGAYLGQTPPGDTPVVFAPEIVSTIFMEHSAPSFSPDGNEVFWYAVPGPRKDSNLFDPDTWYLSKAMRRMDRS